MGGLLLTLISALKSGEGSLTAILLREEDGSLPIVSIQRTRGTRVRVRSKAMMVGSERKRMEEETKELNEDGHGSAADSPETNLSMLRVAGNSKVGKVIK